MEIKALEKPDVNFQDLAELTYATMKRNDSLPEGISKESFLDTISERITEQSHDPIFIVENKGKVVGWLAFYKISDLKIAQIWNWHPIVFPNACMLGSKASAYGRFASEDRIFG